MNTLGCRPCFTGSLTTGADTFVGGSSADVFNALTVKADGADASTLTGFDSIDGGAGNDTLNIYSNGVGKENASLPASATIKNIETINVYNQGGTAFSADGLDASKFVGATAINQIGTVAADVTNLAAGTVAGFNGTAATLSVTAAAAAATAAVSLTNVAEAATLEVSAAEGGVLNSVTVSGTRVDATPATPIDDLDLTVTAGKDVESLSINTSINSKLTVTNAGGKVLSTVDASASTGSINYITAGATVANIKTGAGNDTATLIFAGTATANAATLSTGAGNDVLNVNVTKGAATAVTATVDAGEGNDIINVSIDSATNAGVTYNVAAGAGDDTVVITGTVKTTDKIDGGAGTDTVSLVNNAALVADDYIVFNKVLTNFETLKLTVATTDFDASQLAANYTTVDLAADSIVTKVGAQALIANGDVTATANGFVLDADANTVGNQSTYAGTLNITEKLSGTVVASAQTVNLTVEGGKGDAIASNDVVLSGEAKSATVTLSAGTNTQGTAATTDDTLVASTVEITTGTGANGLKDLASLTLSGNGAADVTNADGTKLVNVDASGLNSVAFDGKAAAGLAYSSTNTAAETIKLGAGLDHVTLGASTYGAIDKVQGLNLVLNTAGDALDVTSDTIALDAGAVFTKFTTTQTDLDLALKDAAAGTSSNVVFQMGGNTYIFQDNAGAANHLLDAGDTVVQLTGQVNLDALVHALA
ncbi:hypothetical protein GHN41_23040 [Pseudomonas helleri]|uniref:Calcium-binding protein n=1 Tax=Pseudomonas helleri TaxID=1608996 RepID=A0A7X1XTI0_9PSED|nr:hypothetical protein [Pseudomonas helleri]MQU19292.1 hypothetical protein [Pseudomonas helleri]